MVEESCDKNQTRCGCEDFDALQAVRMNQFGIKRVCGRADGTPFINATRPNVDGTCPDGYAACSQNTAPDNTTCYNTASDANGENCPITDIKFVENTAVGTYTD